MKKLHLLGFIIGAFACMPLMGCGGNGTEICDVPPAERMKQFLDEGYPAYTHTNIQCGPGNPAQCSATVTDPRGRELIVNAECTSIKCTPRKG